MNDNIFCETCKNLICLYGADVFPVFESICIVYLRVKQPVNIGWNENEGAYFWHVVKYLEKKGFLITTENSLDTYQVKPIGIDMCGIDDEELFCHFCKFSKIDSD